MQAKLSRRLLNNKADIPVATNLNNKADIPVATNLETPRCGLSMLPCLWGPRAFVMGKDMARKERRRRGKVVELSDYLFFHSEAVYNLILSTSSCVSRSFVLSYNLVVRGLSCAAISCACSRAPPLER
jgi:hypothetical protein